MRKIDFINEKGKDAHANDREEREELIAPPENTLFDIKKKIIEAYNRLPSEISKAEKGEGLPNLEYDLLSFFKSVKK